MEAEIEKTAQTTPSGGKIFRHEGRVLWMVLQVGVKEKWVRTESPIDPSSLRHISNEAGDPLGHN